MSERLGARTARMVVAGALALVVGGARRRRVGDRRASGSRLRHGHAQRAGVGRLDRQHVRRQERAREDLGCKVKVTQIAEIPVYQAMADGKVDAVLEDWQHVAQYKQYATKQKRSR